jgi:spore germination protein KC
MKRETITIKLPETDGYFSMALFRSSSELKPKIQKDNWQIHLKAEMILDVYQNASNLEITPQITRMLEQELNAEVERRVREALEAAQKLNADVFGFAGAFHRAYPAIWKQSKARWDEIFPNVEVTTDIKTKVKRPGLVRQPALIPDEEIIKKVE